MVHASEMGCILRVKHSLFSHTSEDSSLSRLQAVEKGIDSVRYMACWKIERSQPVVPLPRLGDAERGRGWQQTSTDTMVQNPS
jgi:hypothetical protein